MRAPIFRTFRLAALSVAVVGCSGHRAPPTQTSVTQLPDSERFALVDIAASSGLNYKWSTNPKKPLTILDSIGNGCAFLDYDQDGNLDILLVGPKLAMFRGDGKGHFTDVSKELGLDKFSGHFLGCAVGDYDNDGFPDIYISGYGTALLLHNVGGRRFEDVTVASGIKPQGWGSSAAFADVDNDGKLDLYVGNYVQFNGASQQYCRVNGVDTSCTPGVYDGLPGRLYHNLGSGRFEDITKSWGLAKCRGKTLGVAFADFDHSGRQSLALANDEVPGELYLNLGGRFENIGAQSGVAYSNVGQPQAGMGQDWGDFDGDGLLDLAVMTFATELKPIYRNLGNRLFADYSAQLGLANETMPYVSFGAKWVDFDNDGWLDLIISNGHIADNIAATGQNYPYQQPTLCFRNEAGMRFNRIQQESLNRRIVGRGLAVGDFDNDGRMDALVVDSEGAPILLHNQSTHTGHWISFRLIGTKSNRDGYGAEITLQTAKRKIVRHCHSDGSYLSSSDSRVHFGLGEESAVSLVSVRWPSGLVQIVRNPKIDRIFTLREGIGPK